jgi:hypothetical protein
VYNEWKGARKSFFSRTLFHTSVVRQLTATGANWEYYLELGVARNASTQEIRNAYKRRAQAIHPDKQTDEKLRKQAEDQMRALNRIMAVLTDAERRREYDLRQFVKNARARPGMVGDGRFWIRVRWRIRRSRWLGYTARHWFWVFAAGLLVLTISSYWLLG